MAKDVFVARPAGGQEETCGHQHSTEGKAVRCAEGILVRRRTLGHVDIIKVGWNKKLERPTSELVITVVRPESDNV